MRRLLFLLLAFTNLRTASTTISTTGTEVGDGHDEYFAQFGPGINIIPGFCAPASITAIWKALNSTADLARAAINAAANFSSPPFNKFFLPDPANATFVAEGMQRVIDTIEGGGVSIGVLCYDISGICGSREGGKSTFAYARPSNISLQVIVYCPAGLALPVNPPPCTVRPALPPTIGEVTLHEFWHLPQISSTERPLEDTSFSTLSYMENVAADSINYAQSYALLGSWSYDLGFLDADKGGKTCIEKIDMVNFDDVTPIKLSQLVTYCLLNGPSDFCGPDFKCLAVRWTRPDVMVGTGFSTHAANHVGACVSVYSDYDYIG